MCGLEKRGAHHSARPRSPLAGVVWTDYSPITTHVYRANRAIQEDQMKLMLTMSFLPKQAWERLHSCRFRPSTPLPQAVMKVKDENVANQRMTAQDQDVELTQHHYGQ